jgi:hypothetical protein
LGEVVLKFRLTEKVLVKVRKIKTKHYEKEKKDKELWDKHYKKYKLEWRSESRW